MAIHNPVTIMGVDSDGNSQPISATDHAVHFAAQNSSLWAWPEYQYIWDSVTGAAAATIYTSGDVSWANRFTLNVASLTATSADVYVSVDGTTFVAATLFDAATGAPFATAAITANGTYYLDGKYKAIRVDQVGAGGVVITWSHGNI